MDKSRYLIVILAAALVFSLSACSKGDVPSSSDILTQAFETAVQELTSTAAAKPLATETPAPPTPTVTLVVPTNTFAGTLTAEAGFGPLPTSPGGGELTPTLLPPTAYITPTTDNSNGLACLRASFEYETIPDGTRIPRDKTFIKLWRLKNVGSCTWDSSYALVWVSGDLIGAQSVVKLTDVNIYTYDYVEVEVPMKTPLETGPLKGYWMLRSGDGKLFGLGPNGTDWFWVSIVVYNPEFEN
ncbi:MAG: NBR1-Ig-like domain-containing protein [Anaerolineae bacterium]|nr:NBR1-Ig-like domain-containing protein [Anaerolineae bacterium]